MCKDLRREDNLWRDLEQALQSLDRNIRIFHGREKVPIDGTYFDVRFARSLSEVSHLVLDSEDCTATNLEKLRNLINTQLIFASESWRKVTRELTLKKMECTEDK